MLASASMLCVAVALVVALAWAVRRRFFLLLSVSIIIVGEDKAGRFYTR